MLCTGYSLGGSKACVKNSESKQQYTLNVMPFHCTASHAFIRKLRENTHNPGGKCQTQMHCKMMAC